MTFLFPISYQGIYSCNHDHYDFLTLTMYFLCLHQTKTLTLVVKDHKTVILCVTVLEVIDKRCPTDGVIRSEDAHICHLGRQF